MKTSSCLYGALTALAIAFCQLSGKTAPLTNAAISAPLVSSNAIPLSVFTIPASRKDGCDPFNPKSTRLWGMSIVTPVPSNPHKATGLDCLVLKGLSGVATDPLAMINGRTMGRGEDAEINTDCGRLLVHCVDITTNSAIIEVAGERRELQLRTGL